MVTNKSAGAGRDRAAAKKIDVEKHDVQDSAVISSLNEAMNMYISTHALPLPFLQIAVNCVS